LSNVSLAKHLNSKQGPKKKKSGKVTFSENKTRDLSKKDPNL